MKSPPSNNIPIDITKINDNTIQVSGKFLKNDYLSNDPNIGALSLIGSTLRKLGWEGEIIFTKHHLNEKHVNNSNKLLSIMSSLKIKLNNLEYKNAEIKKNLTGIMKKGEKIATIFFHLIV